MLLQANKHSIKASIQLPGSKSISNRMLILKKVLGAKTRLKNLSDARDTQDLLRELHHISAGKSGEIDIGHAGTDMRFLTGLLSITEGEWILTGSERMKERPIGGLVNALRQLGAEISYTGRNGFPPLKIKGKTLAGGKIKVKGNISSQFISALLLISPTFRQGLEITIINKIVSRPYIQMTVSLMKQFGISISFGRNRIRVQKPKGIASLADFQIESDWSSASYWYGIAAMSKNAEITLKGLAGRSLQADAVLPEIYRQLGVSTTFKNGSAILRTRSKHASHFKYDFTECPDIAQTVAVTCFGLGISCNLSGLSTLKNKETDRLKALKTELKKFGAAVTITDNNLTLQPAGKKKSKNLKTIPSIHTYNDHRMAMSFAPLVLKYGQMKIEDPQVVEKSYPRFWKHLKKAGIH